MTLDVEAAIERLAAELVEDAPPLSAEQLGRLRVIFGDMTIGEEKAA